MHRHDHTVARLDDLLRLDSDAGPGLEETAHVLRDPFDAQVGAGVGKLRPHDEHDERVKQVDASLKIALAPPLVNAPDRLHVLLRHRLLR
jgi:hypothetical protein